MKKKYHLFADEYVEGLEKQVEELKAKIEKMRNCENCKHNLETFPFCDSSSCDEDTLINWEFGK